MAEGIFSQTCSGGHYHTVRSPWAARTRFVACLQDHLVFFVYSRHYLSFFCTRPSCTLPQRWTVCDTKYIPGPLALFSEQLWLMIPGFYWCLIHWPYTEPYFDFFCHWSISPAFVVGVVLTRMLWSCVVNSKDSARISSPAPVAYRIPLRRSPGHRVMRCHRMTLPQGVSLLPGIVHMSRRWELNS